MIYPFRGVDFAHVCYFKFHGKKNQTTLQKYNTLEYPIHISRKKNLKCCTPAIHYYYQWQKYCSI